MGSSSYITNAAGIVTQHLEYMAFGEVFVEEHSNSLNSPFKFNGKELDGETGNYYYGARYYDPKLSIFISVDPLAEQTMSAYGYCYNNPVNLIDPTGMWPWPTLTQIKSFVSGVKSGITNYSSRVDAHFKSEVNGLKNAYTSPKAALSYAIKHSGPVILYNAVANTVSTPINAVKNIANGNYKAIGDAYGTQLANGVVAVATTGTGVIKAPVNNTMQKLAADVQTTITNLNNAGKSPATVIGAELNGQTVISTSGAPPTNIAPQLEAVSAELGGVGTKTASGNTVGCCSEFHAANELLLQNPSAKPTDVKFTDAIRPRTGEVVPPCENCKTTFGL